MRLQSILSKELDEDALFRIVAELQSKNPSEPYDNLEVWFGLDGHLQDGAPEQNLVQWNWDATARRSVKSITPNPDYLPATRNDTFVDAIRLIDIPCGKPRHGWAKFEKLNGVITHMSFKQYKELAPQLIRGWLIGNFAHRKYYGSYEIYCLKVLV
jgi:hypothetical protein